jgi:DNA-binding response OmpR family regulator
VAGVTGKLRILLADGDESFRSFVAGLLRPRGAELVQVKTAAAAKRIAADYDVDLAVIDARLEDGSGAELITALRASGTRCPVIFMQEGWQEQNSYRHLTDKLDVRRVLHKPFSAYEFIVEIDAALGEASAAVAPTAAPIEDHATTANRRKRSYPSMPALEASPASQRQITTLALLGNDEQLAAMTKSAAEDAILQLVPMADAEELLGRLGSEALDGALIMLDPRDPDVGFAEATEVLCSDPGKNLPIGFVCSKADVALQVDAIHAGGCFFLGAPIVAEHLQQAATRMAELRRGPTPQLIVVAGLRQGQALTLALDDALVDTEVVPHGQALLRRLEAFMPDLIVYDLDTPGVSGRDVCKLLRASPRWGGLPVILLCSHDSTEARIAAFEAGADDMLIKPVQAEELVTRCLARMQRTRDGREVADRDPRTGLLRRHAFVERAQAMTAEAGRAGRVAAICVLGLDASSAIPARRERQLADVSAILTAQLRTYDLRARWEDEEIILALADVDATAAKPLLERLLGLLSDKKLYCSAGVAIFPEDDHVMPELVKAARRRLRRAQRAGGQVALRDPS